MTSSVITAGPDGSNVRQGTIDSDDRQWPGQRPDPTFWFAWGAGKEFLPANPLSVPLPTGWKDVFTHGGSTDGYAIHFDALSSA